MPTGKEIEKIEKATLFDFYLIVDSSEKKEYTKEEILELIKTIARAKEN